MNLNFNYPINKIFLLADKIGLVKPIHIFKIKYFLKFRSFLNLHDPKTLNEKIIWLSLKTDTTLWSHLSDKYEVREYLKKCSLEHILIKLYGVYETAEEINFDTLPSSFVIKTNNGSATVMLIKDKSKIDFIEVKKKLNKWLNIPYGLASAESHYRRIKPLIIIEEFLEEENVYSTSLIDYKVWCFNGIPYFVFTACNRDKKVKFGLYDANSWDCLNHHISSRHRYDKVLERPKNLTQMIEYAKILSKDFPQVRVDFYEVNKKIYFGELTFTSHGGLTKSYTKECLNIMGDLIKL